MPRALVLFLAVLQQATQAAWLRIGDAPWAARSAATVTYDPSTGGYLMAGGTEGWNGSDTAHYWLNEVWRIDAAEGNWTKLASDELTPWQPRQNPGFAATRQGVAILAGGEAWHPPTQDKDTWNDVWSMDLSTGAFSQLPDAPWQARTGHGLVALDDDTLLMAGGGSCRSCAVIKKFADVWEFKLSTKQWKQRPDAPWQARWFHGMAATSAGEVVVAGGQAGFLSLHDVWKMDTGGKWSLLTQKAPWSGRSQFALMASPVAPVMVLAGGTGFSAEDSVWQLHTETWEWTQLPSLPSPNIGPALTVWGSVGIARVSGGSVPCRGWHCGSQTLVQTSQQWQVVLNATGRVANA